MGLQQRDTDEKQVDRGAAADVLWEAQWGKPPGEGEGEGAAP